MTGEELATMTDEELARIGLKRFDMADYLQTDEEIAAYLNAVLQDGDAAELARALGYIARARGMTQIARDTGLTREVLYKALRPGASPRFDTLQRVARALGIRFVAQVDPIREPATP